MQQEIEKRPVGGLDTTNNLQDVAPIDYTDAKNLTNNNREVNTAVDLRPLKGIEYSFASLQPVSAKGKAVRFFINPENNPSALPVGNICTIQFETIRGVSFGGSLLVANPPVINETTLRAAVLTFITSAAFTGIGITGSCGTLQSYTLASGGTVYYFDISFNIREDWNIIVTMSSGIDQYFTQVVEEFITASYNSRQMPSKIIGSCRTSDKTFLFWTPSLSPTTPFPNYSSPSISSITNVVNLAAASNARVTTSSDHGLYTGEIIELSGGTGTYGSSFNGNWIITVVTATTFDLNYSAATAFPVPSGTLPGIRLIDQGFGAISVITRDTTAINSQFSQKTDLVLAKGLKFTQEFQIDARVKKNGEDFALKFTDYNNPPKMLIYSGVINANGFIYGALSFNPGRGYYFYETIDFTSRMLVGDNDFVLGVIHNPLGGSLLAKNYVYYARGVFNDFTKTSVSRPSNPTTVIPNSGYSGYLYSGGFLDEPTTGLNSVIVNNIPQNVYSFIELIAVEYNDNSIRAYVVSRAEISPGQDKVTIDHLGSEIYEPLSLSEINALFLYIDKARNIEEMDGRGVLSNVVLKVDENLNAIAQAVTCTISRRLNTRWNDLAALDNNSGEYLQSSTIKNYSSYMLFETVRWGLRVKWKNAGWSKSYWVGDFRVDDVAASRKTPLPNLDLGTATNTYSFYFQFTNLNLDVLIGDVPLRSLIEDFEFVREEVTQEVMHSGVWVPGVTLASPPTAGEVYAADIGVNPNAGAFGTLDRQIGYYFSPDLTYRDAPLFEAESGDQVINMGAPAYIPNALGTAPNGNYNIPNVGEGFEMQVDNGATNATIETVNVEDIQPLVFTSGLTVLSAISVDGKQITPCIGNAVSQAAYPTINLPIPATYALAVDANLTNGPSGNADLLLYNIFYLRPQANPYPLDVTLSSYYSVGFTGADVENDTTSTVYSVFGGECFVQKTYWYASNDLTAAPINNTRIGVYSINRKNSQVQAGMYPGFGGASTSMSNAVSILITPTNGSNLLFGYSTCFNWRNITSRYVSFNENIGETGVQEATVYWSNQSIINSQFNADRYFLVANQRSLNLIDGPITDMKRVNDILITLQPNYTERQYFDNTGKLISDVGDVLLGTGAVMGRKGDSLSQYGCSNKWGVFVGRSDGGKDVLYFIDSIRKKIVRWGLDGAVVLSDRENMTNYLYQYLALTEFFDSPVYNYGISGVWDEKNKWAIFSVRAYVPPRELSGDWTDTNFYSIGEIVNDPLANYDYGNMPSLFECIADNTADPSNRPASNSAASQLVWRKIPLTDKRYFNYFTLVFSEQENKFKWFLSPVPSIYASYYDTYITTDTRFQLDDSLSIENKLYIHDESGYQCEWFKKQYSWSYAYTYNNTNVISSAFLYTLFPLTAFAPNLKVYFVGPDDGLEYEVTEITEDELILDRVYPFTGADTTLTVYICLQEDAFITPVINESRGQLVKFGALRYDSTLPIYRVDLNTQDHKSYLVQADFESIDNYEYAPIQNDTTAGNLPSADTSMLYGKYCLIKTTLRAKNDQIIHKFVVRVRALNRKFPR
jgi:hypothetical protein